MTNRNAQANRMHDLETFARQTMNEHGFAHVPIKWMTSRRTLGCVVFNRVTDAAIELKLSRTMLPALPIDDARDVVLHEVAHLIAGRRAKHGLLWRQACRITGAKPEIYKSVDDTVRMATASCHIKCQQCGHVVPLARRKRDLSRWSHIGCGGRFEYV